MYATPWSDHEGFVRSWAQAYSDQSPVPDRRRKPVDHSKARTPEVSQPHFDLLMAEDSRYVRHVPKVQPTAGVGHVGDGISRPIFRLIDP